MLDLIIHCCTWNVGDEGPPKDNLNAFLGVDGDSLPDIISVALQEIIDLNSWRKVLISFLGPKDYVLMKSRSFWAIGVFVFIKRNLLVAVTNVESEVTALGFGGVAGNKGAISVRFEICGVNLIVVSAHFHAHEGGQMDRLNDYMDTLDAQSFRDEDVHKIIDHDYVFWVGDLNFRLEGIGIDQVKNSISKGELQHLLNFDQLTTAKKKGIIFNDFTEGKIEFPPTFKYDKQSDQYDTSAKQRVPAWTDRILFMSHRDFAIDYHLNNSKESSPAYISQIPRRRQTRGAPSEVELRSANERLTGLRKPEITLVKYTALKQYKSSDHRPVIGVFRFAVPTHWYSLPVKFLKPSDSTYTIRVPVRFIYQTPKHPELLHFSDENSRRVSKPVVRQSPITENLLLTISRLTMADSDQPSEGTSLADNSLLGQHVIPDQLEQRSRDEIRLYSSGFVDLENNYLSLDTGKPLQQSTKPDDSGEIFSGTVPVRNLRSFVGRSVLLVFNSAKKNCPQGYSSEFTIKA